MQPRRGGLAYDRLRDLLVRGEIKPGAPIDPAGLTIETGAERAALDEALARLEAEGLVETRDGALRATPLTRKRSIDLVDAFELVLPPVYRIATRVLTEEELAVMRAALDDAAEAGAAHDGIRVLAAWRRFHLVAFSAVGNEEFTRFWLSIWPRAERFALVGAPHFPAKRESRHLEEVWKGLDRRQSSEAIKPLLQNYERLRAASELLPDDA